MTTSTSGAWVQAYTNSTPAPPVEAKPVSPFISIDDPEELEPHQDPYEAAKQIRVLARQLIDAADDSYAINEIQSYLSHVSNFIDSETAWIEDLMKVLPTRKVSLIREKIEHLQSTRSRTKTYVAYAKGVVHSGASGNNHQTAEQIHKLAQSLPTIPGAPVMPFDQTLRAIATLLKNADYFNLDEKGQPKPINYSDGEGSDDYDDEE